jgi:hypothetical protein
MPDTHATDERLNLRPIVLSACFAWGVICGFLFHVLHQPTETIKPQPDKVVGENGDAEKTGKPKIETSQIPVVPNNPVDVDKPPVNEDQPPLPETGTKAQASLRETAPEPPELPLDPKAGLNGATAAAPAMPLRVSDTPELPSPVKNNAPLPPPELDF